MRASSMRVQSESSLSQAAALNADRRFSEKLALYKGTLVQMVQVKHQEVSLTRQDLIDLVNLKELSNDNIQSFIGASVEPGHVCYLVQHCSRGCLQLILENDDVKLDWFFRISLISDLANGLAYLHKSKFHSHGHVTSLTCHVDTRWALKIDCIQLPLFRDDHDHKRATAGMDGTSQIIGKPTAKVVEDDGDDDPYEKLLWTAPELLRMPGGMPPYGTQKGDMYSFGIVAQEIAYRAAPFFSEDRNAKDIVDEVRAGFGKEGQLCRPQPPAPLTEMPQLLTLMTQCWAEDPQDRPSIADITKQLRRLNRGKKFDIIDLVLQKLEKYANNLELIVEQRTAELLEEKKKTDFLLKRMLPPFVAEQLKMGNSVPPELHDNVTIYFSDIAGFTNLSSQSTPMQVVDLLNNLYGTFDDTISKHDVYKVETIGDAYMVVSGLPRPNEGRHIVEICNMALDLLKEVGVFVVPHRPDYNLKLRIGVHTGPCAAGVVGHTMPRYCLFGDTVNLASRMEATGEASRIQLSTASHFALSLFPGYKTTLRGDVYVQGKGSTSMTTYWLEGKEDSIL